MNPLTLLASLLLAAAPLQRESIDLSGRDWNITLDFDASWENEELHLPPVEVDALPVRIPSGGWNLLETPQVTGVHLPATVEEYLWGWNGESFGVTGNYVGVSWFETTVEVPSEWKGRRVSIDFEAVRFRAEVFVNHRLVGYDLVNSTPFSFDISDALEYGGRNVISVRITDPNGNFNWKDSQVYTWGEYRTNPTHGFGGITGSVQLTATDRTYVSDVFVQNRPDPHAIAVQVTVQSDRAAQRTLELSIRDKAGTEVYRKSWYGEWEAGENVRTVDIRLPRAELWSVDDPNLYDLTVRVGEDAQTRRFGFRWFEVRDVQGDRQFYLNGKRIVVRTSISWSFWPDNGIMPSDELARRQVESAKALGLNMLNFHRTIGQRRVLDWADELGLLYWEEPGGNQYPAGRFNDDDLQSRFYFGYRDEKLRRMILRDRSHPSLVIYNMHNERGAAPQRQDYEQMAMGHRLDPTRILVYNSSNGENPENEPNARFKTHLMPFEQEFRDYGWWDNHHAGGPGVYHDALYVDRDHYLRGSSHRDEIIYWGEEGAIGTPPRLALIRDEILRSGKTESWEAQDYLGWYDAYDSFLKERGFSKAFPSVDALTTAMGNVAYYYQGRIIENIRINNIVDGYAINGWESFKHEDHSGVVDNYRFLKGDPELIARYNRPLVLSVKLNHKVLPAGRTTVADVFIINELDLKGTYTLELWLKGEDGTEEQRVSRKVRVSGGTVYGECLADGFSLTVRRPGYSRVEARLLDRRGEPVCEGFDEIFAVQPDASGIPSRGSIADKGGHLAAFLGRYGIEPSVYQSGTPEGDWLLVGDFEPDQWGSGMSDIMEWVYKGHTLVVVDNPERWAEYFADKEVLDYRGSKVIGTAWYGGNFFNRADPVWTGLPQDRVFNWEYQCFATYNRRRIGLRCESGDILAAAVADHKKEVYSVLSRIRAGRGQVLLTTLDIPACVGDVPAVDASASQDGLAAQLDIDGANEAMGTFDLSEENYANVVGQQLLLNLLKSSKALR
ncbi:MAG: beta-glycosidase [Bacteroidales bacterium]|nr:beta-glycosidase [Bacteroidales bacterium]